MPKIAVVLTTINSGSVLEGYCNSASQEGMQDEVQFIVIPDKKTPNELRETCNQWAKLGFDIRCPDLLSQEFFLSKFDGLKNLIPYNTDNRRNVGYLMALESGAEIIYSLDDDNFAIPENNCFKEIKVVGTKSEEMIVESGNGWYNICQLLRLQRGLQVKTEIYPRGFPYYARFDEEVVFGSDLNAGIVMMNAGLWLGSPDVDAITWLGNPTKGEHATDSSIFLGDTAWSPINTQNTALHRDVMSTYYFTRMGYPLQGMPIDRYGDIFSGYLSQACVRHMGHRIRIGSPIADHRRNAHNYLKDLQGELACILTLEDILPWLTEVKLQGSTYSEAYLSLADSLEGQLQKFTGSIWTDATRGYFHQLAYCMREWIKACTIIG